MTPDPNQLTRGEQTRQAIIIAAHAVFMQTGYHGASLRQIAKQAGLAVGGIYNHFASKEEIFSAVLSAYHPHQIIMPALQSVEGSTAKETISNVASAIRPQLLRSVENIIPIALIELMEFRGQHLKQLFIRNIGNLEAFFERLRTKSDTFRDFSNTQLILSFVSFFFGYLVVRFFLKDLPQIQEQGEKSFDVVLDIYLHGVLKPTPRVEK
jgi:AcrR family transcriptional regulator